MKFLEGHQPAHDLTYEDVCIVPQESDVRSRSDVDLTTHDGTGNTIPIVVANMNAVAGKRMAETVARRGGIVALPQDLSPERLVDIIRDVKAAHTIYETPLTLTPDNTINDAMNLIHKRAHGAVIVVDENRRPTGIFTEKDRGNYEGFSALGELALPEPITMKAGLSPKQAHYFLTRKRLKLAPVTDQGRLVGIMTEDGALRTAEYTPNVDGNGRLQVIATIGINGNTEQKTEIALEAGADILMVDTAHGHQRGMKKALQVVRKTAGDNMTIIAGNVVTAEGTRYLHEAGADIIKVGVGPGAMCTTRIMTGVGRPQFSAVLDCATEAHKHGKTVLADGGIRKAGDVALALAAGANNVMIGTWFAGTYESAADMKGDENKGFYKENFGMASARAVEERYKGLSKFERARKLRYDEGISDSTLFLDPKMPGAQDLIDHIVHGVQSAFTYAGARNIAELHDRAVIGVQSAAGFHEGRPVPTSW